MQPVLSRELTPQNSRRELRGEEEVRHGDDLERERPDAAYDELTKTMSLAETD